MTVPEYVQRRIRDNTLESLREVMHLSPTNALALARLAKLTLAQDADANPRRLGEADFFSRRAVELAPNNGEVQRIRTEIIEKTKASSRP
jgi:hypothetical protein